MTENVENTVDETNGSVITFDNLVILKEFGNIVSLVRNEDFLETVPKAKLKRVKWVPMFNCLKQGIYNEMVQELTSMWEFENMPEKLDQLDRQKEKFSDVNEDQALWRPQLSNIKSQLKASDVANLRKQKSLLETLAKEYETRVNRLMRILSAKRGYIKALQMDIQKYQKKNDDFISKIDEKFKNHNQIVRLIYPENVDVETNWTDNELTKK